MLRLLFASTETTSFWIFDTSKCMKIHLTLTLDTFPIYTDINIYKKLTDKSDLGDAGLVHLSATQDLERI